MNEALNDPQTSLSLSRRALLSSWWNFGQKVLLGITLSVMILHFLIYVVYSIELIQFPFDYDQGEGFELVDTIYLSEGKMPYRDNETAPFYASNYPPIYHVVLIPFAWLFGPGYWYGRLVSFLGTLITAYAIGYAIYRAEKRREIALLMGLAFLASNYIYHIGPLFRQHYFMVMFEVVAVVLLAPPIRATTSSTTKTALVGSIFAPDGGVYQATCRCDHCCCLHLAIYSQPTPRSSECNGLWGCIGCDFLFIEYYHGRRVVDECGSSQCQSIHP